MEPPDQQVFKDQEVLRAQEDLLVLKVHKVLRDPEDLED